MTSMDTGEEFAFTVSRQADRATVEVRGELDAATGPSLSEAVGALTGDGLVDVVVDLDHVTFIDSKGLSALLESHRAAADHHMRFSVMNLQPAVARMFRIAGVDAVLLNGHKPD